MEKNILSKTISGERERKKEGAMRTRQENASTLQKKRQGVTEKEMCWGRKRSAGTGAWGVRIKKKGSADRQGWRVGAGGERKSSESALRKPEKGRGIHTRAQSWG